MKGKRDFKALLNRLRYPGNGAPSSVGGEKIPGVTNEEAGAIQSLCYSDLKYPNTNQFQSFRSYIRMAGLAFHSGCRSILEIGAGLSTAVWARYAQKTGAEVHTIDMDFGAMKAMISNTEYEALIAKNIDLVTGASVTPGELSDFYTGAPKERFGGIEVTSFADNLDLFKNTNWLTPECREVAALVSGKNWSVRDLVVNGGTLVFPRRLLDIFSSGKNFDAYIDMLGNFKVPGQSGVLDNMIANGARWDMVFLDSGELSSMIEWLKVKSRIILGGLVALHDIFFPRSFKNFVVCASLLADADWKIVYIDDSTKQGLLVAKRMRL